MMHISMRRLQVWRVASGPSRRTFPSIRGFHSSTKLGNSLLDTCCATSFELMSSLHSSTGVSWVFILPLTAVLVRGVVAVPTSIWARNNLRKLRKIQPLLLAWMPKIQKDVVRSNPGLGPAACEVLVHQQHRKKSAEIYRSFGIVSWSAYGSLLQIPFFLITIETIRQMCSDRVGLLGSMTSFFSGEEYHSVIPIQSSLAVEGTLWFPDLLQPDPLFILPVTLSALLYGSVAYNNRLQRGLSTARADKTSEWTIMLKTASIGILLVTPTLPAAILVYWVSSSTFALLTTYALERAIPVQSAMVPCRPLVKPYLRTSVPAAPAQSPSFLRRWAGENL